MWEKKLEFNVAGLFQNTRIILEIIKIVEIKLGYKIPIKYIYGAPGIKWNGGRVIFNSKISKEDIVEEFELLKESNLLPIVTLTNHLITKEDLNDKLGNELLNILNFYEGNVIVTNAQLEEYINKNYPNIKIKASLIKIELENGKGDIEYYKSLEKNYNSYVLHPDDNNNETVLNFLDKTKCEILLNERCIKNCNLRKYHYDSICREQISLSTKNFHYENFLEKCSAIPEIKQVSTQENNISVSINDFKKLVNNGFYKYKIQGRTDNIYIFIFDMLKYFLDIEKLSIVYPIICSYLDTLKTKGEF